MISEHRDESKFRKVIPNIETGKNSGKVITNIETGQNSAKEVTKISMGEQDSVEGQKSRHERIHGERVEGSTTAARNTQRIRDELADGSRISAR